MGIQGVKGVPRITNTEAYAVILKLKKKKKKEECWKEWVKSRKLVGGLKICSSDLAAGNNPR